ncbi:unnamed protein product [Vitrella brassicaformis CCMP3155]|uniref:FAST kinase leucine-rich domain-containing protein n=1 Tax=Vitrella brassicaformis (strain CCMP3155) TaxID=1169540 RepID=A0A0G4GZR3_VITBC|nr:unnamed protein product [Vitrella brassicaformis CCMP3155]|eukprot:CEM36728.1 unnamed protein product [Vitrella brassicaformis CCMP3155]
MSRSSCIVRQAASTISRLSLEGIPPSLYSERLIERLTSVQPSDLSLLAAEIRQTSSNSGADAFLWRALAAHSAARMGEMEPSTAAFLTNTFVRTPDDRFRTSEELKGWLRAVADMLTKHMERGSGGAAPSGRDVAIVANALVRLPLALSEEQWLRRFFRQLSQHSSAPDGIAADGVDGPAVAMLTNAMARCGAVGREDALPAFQRFSAALQRPRPNLMAALELRSVAAIANAYAHFHIVDGPLFRLLSDKARGLLAKRGSESGGEDDSAESESVSIGAGGGTSCVELGMLVNAWARVDLRDEGLVREVMGAMVSRGLVHVGSGTIATVLNGLAKVAVKDEGFLSAVSSLLQERLAARTAAYAPSGSAPGDSNDPADVAAPLTARDVANATDAFARLGYHDPTYLHFVAAWLHAALEELQPMDVVALASSFARLRFRDQPAFHVLAAALKANIADFSLPQLAAILTAYARLRISDTRTLTSIAHHIYTAITPQRPGISPRHRRLAARASRQPQTRAAAAAAPSNESDPDEPADATDVCAMVSILSGFGRLDVSHPEFFDAAGGWLVRQGVDSIGTSDLREIVSCSTPSQPHWPPA